MKFKKPKLNSLPEYVEAFFLIAVFLIFSYWFGWVLYHITWVLLFTTITLPIVSVWLTKFHQKKFKKSNLGFIQFPFMAISFVCAYMMLQDFEKYETYVESKIISGNIQKKRQYDEGTDEVAGGYYTQYSFEPKTKAGEIGTDIIGWIVFVLPIAGVYVTCKYIDKLKEAET